jgi:hypothetical protein
MLSSNKNIGRPEKKILIDNTHHNYNKVKKIINVTVIKIKDRKYYVSSNNQVYDIRYHVNIGKLLNNKIFYNSSELESEDYI